MEPDYQNNIDDLPRLSDYRYENLFKVYKIDDYYIYNIINSISFDTDISPDYYYEWKINRSLPWTTISYLHYDTIQLWWLICIMNNIMNPVTFPETGTSIKVIKPKYVRKIIDNIISKINE